MKFKRYYSGGSLRSHLIKYEVSKEMM